MTDKFFSGWGCAQGKICKRVMKCETYEQAEHVAEHGRNEAGCIYVNICMNKPRYDSRRYFVREYDYNEDLGGKWKLPQDR